MIEKILATHLERRATVYLRQSTLKQVHEHRESTTRQYALRERAIELGWPAHSVEVIDEDLGQSGSSSEGRPGFQRLSEDVARGRVGAILALEVSRLARCSADWHRLLDLCGLADVIIIDEQAIYTPGDYNDRLLLGLKGTMSEAEQYWMRLRLQGGRLNKARRGDLRLPPPAGYVWDASSSRFRFDPDEQVQRVLRLVFERFRVDGSAYAVVRYFARRGLRLPTRASGTGPVHWVPPRHSLLLCFLRNPIYSGAYVFGRTEMRVALVDGQLRRRQTRVGSDAWKICLRDHHPAYLTWEEFMDNQQKLLENRSDHRRPEQRGAAREGHGMLQGLVLCGRCGHRMSTHYPGNGRRAQYRCDSAVRHAGASGLCCSAAGDAVDQSVVELFLGTVQPPEIELALQVVREVERQADQIDRQWKLRLDRARYEAQLAERRYKAVDPDNRVVARTLEREWNEKLRDLAEIEQEHQDIRRREKLDLSVEDRARILALARDLPRVWNATTTTHTERKNLLRMLVREVTLQPIDVPRRVMRVQVLWQTGAVNDFTIARRRAYYPRAVSPKVAEIVRTLFSQHRTDAEIAAELNRQGLRSQIDRRWGLRSVRELRRQQGLERLHANKRYSRTKGEPVRRKGHHA